MTGDAGLLDEQRALHRRPADSRRAPKTPTTRRRSAARRASVYEHGARAIDRSLATGAHGLPLMGTGDWNDGMNRVGHEGRGESVWLAWFLCSVVERFAPLARRRAASASAPQRWRAARDGWIAALHDAGWDGAWFRRAFFDNGAPLGSSANDECRIDLIAQAWSVLSGASTPTLHRRRRMASMKQHLHRRRRPACCACWTRRWRIRRTTPATSRPTRPACARTAASTRTAPCGR